MTGASTGIGYELAKCCVANGFDLVVVADEAEIKKAAKDFEAMGAKVDALQADLATLEGVDKLYALIGGRSVDALLANAGRGLGKGFLDQDFDDVNLGIARTFPLTSVNWNKCRHLPFITVVQGRSSWLRRAHTGKGISSSRW